MSSEKEQLRLSLVKLDKEIVKEEKLLQDIKKCFESIRVKLDKLIETNEIQVKELSTLNITKNPYMENCKIPFLELMTMSTSFSLQYLAIQQKIQAETREFVLLSNIMKCRHEAAKNAINNLR